MSQALNNLLKTEALDSQLNMLKPLGEFKNIELETGKRLVRFISKSGADGQREFPESVGAIIPAITLDLQKLAGYPSLQGMLQDALQDIQAAALRRYAVGKAGYIPEDSLGYAFIEDYAELVRPICEADILGYFADGKVDALVEELITRNPNWDNAQVEKSLNLYKGLLGKALLGKGYQWPNIAVADRVQGAAKLLGMAPKFLVALAKIQVAGADADGL